MTEYKLTDEYIISGVQLAMLHYITGFDEQATIIVENVLEHKVENTEGRNDNVN